MQNGIQGQALIQRGLREAYIINGAGEIRARGERSYLFWYEQPTAEDLDRAQRDGLVLLEDWKNNEFRALVALPPLVDRYLYVTRDVDGNLLGLLDDTRATVGDYRQLEQTRGQVLFEFSLVVVAVAAGVAQQFDFLLPFEIWDWRGWRDISDWRAWGDQLSGPGAWLAGLGIHAQVLGALIAGAPAAQMQAAGTLLDVLEIDPAARDTARPARKAVAAR